jgi:26S proteasome regulatory subunit N6
LKFKYQAKTAKIVRTVIEIVCEVPDALEVQIGLCNQVVAWCLTEKRSFLRQRVQSKLAALLLKSEQYNEALALASRLIKELKKLDDKQLLVETHLVEARIQHALRNVPKAKAALTTARTNANAIYVVPLMQGVSARRHTCVFGACEEPSLRPIRGAWVVLSGFVRALVR